MAKATVELDFLGMDKDSSSKSRLPNFFNRQRSFRDIQSAISRINPEILKSVIASGSVSHQSPENGNQMSCKMSFPAPNDDQPPFPGLPVYSPIARPALDNLSPTAPLTIFYNGAVAVFDVPRDKAETILKIAENGTTKSGESTNQEQLLQTLNGDLPIARRKSLQRFLEKRKERLTAESPYSCPPDSRS